MQKNRYAKYQKTLLRYATKHRQRTLSTARGIDFSSNDYLAFSNSLRIKNAIHSALDNGLHVGSGGSRLLRGNHHVFEKLESAAANFFVSDNTLYFISGYTANLAIFTSLPQPGDLVLYDERVHASMREGIKAGRAQAISIRHNDLENAEDRIREWRKNGGMGYPWLAVESLYSMDGDHAPLFELSNLMHRYEGFLVIDEAHATGVFGPNGRGLSAFLGHKENLIVLHTCGKALGAAGALISLNHLFYNYLINTARIFIFSTAPSPLVAVGVNEALNILMEEPNHRNRLEQLYLFANEQFTKLSGRKGSNSQILPVILGKNSLAIKIANIMQAHGYDVRAIRPPSVPQGTSRLRISITLHVDEIKINRMFSLLFYLLNKENS